MRKKLLTAAVVILLFCGITLPVSAEQMPYTSYTYSYSGEYQVSPDAFAVSRVIQAIDLSDRYVPDKTLLSKNDTEKQLFLNDPYDIVTDSRGYSYIADTGNNRVIVLNESFNAVHIIMSYVCNGSNIQLKGPQGLFVDKNDDLYIADTGNGNIVKFSKAFEFSAVVAPPSSEILPEDFSYIPTAVSVDKYGRFYVICSGTNDGVVTFETDGSFKGFIGANKVTVNPADKFWRSIMSDEQKAQLVESVPNSYNNITVDNDGFVYVTCSSIDAYTLKQIVTNRTSSSPYMPIKKLNPSGVDVLKRNGFFAPVGEVSFDAYSSVDGNNPSAITEITVLENGVYSAVDSQNNKIFTYDESGNLLYAFGTTGTKDGTFDLLQAISYKSMDTMIALDRKRNSLTVFQKTDYGNLIDKVIQSQKERKFSETMKLWKEILKINNNYDLAYLGVGKTLMAEGNYKEAMLYFRTINNKQYYNKAFEKYRSQVLEKFGFLIPLLIVALIYLIYRFLRFAKKYNMKKRFEKDDSASKRFLSRIMFGFYIIFHPFDGFWDLKKEKRGGTSGACFWLVLAVLAMVSNKFFSGYLISDSLSTDNLFSVFGNILIPFVLWCLVNWCLTALMDGKGKGSDIFNYTCYSLIPLSIIIIPASVISNFLTSDEMIFITYAVNVAMVWCGLLIFIGCMTTHEYSLGKNTATCALTIVGMGIVLFLMLLFVYVLGRTLSFVNNIFTEISFRL